MGDLETPEIKEIERQHPLAQFYEEDARSRWPARWDAVEELVRRLKLAGTATRVGLAVLITETLDAANVPKTVGTGDGRKLLTVVERVQYLREQLRDSESARGILARENEALLRDRGRAASAESALGRLEKTLAQLGRRVLAALDAAGAPLAVAQAGDSPRPLSLFERIAALGEDRDRWKGEAEKNGDCAVEGLSQYTKDQETIRRLGRELAASESGRARGNQERLDIQRLLRETTAERDTWKLQAELGEGED